MTNIRYKPNWKVWFFFQYLVCFWSHLWRCWPWKWTDERAQAKSWHEILFLICSQEPPSNQKMNCPSPSFRIFYSSIVQQSDFGRGKDWIICFGLSYHQIALELPGIYKRWFPLHGDHFSGPIKQIVTPSKVVYVTCQKKKMKPWLGKCRHVW